LKSELSRVVIKQAQEVIIVSDCSKFGQVGLSKICKMEVIYVFITNPPIPLKISRDLHSMDVRLVTQSSQVVYYFMDMT